MTFLPFSMLHRLTIKINTCLLLSFRVRILLMPLFLILVSNFYTFAQSGPTIRLKAGLLEFVQAGFYSPVGQCRIGGSIGTGFERELSVSADIYYYFGKHRNKNGDPAWYLRGGINYLFDPPKSMYSKTRQVVHAPTYIGYEYLIGHVGIFLEGGPGLFLWRKNYTGHDVLDKQSRGLRIFPGIAAGLVIAL